MAEPLCATCGNDDFGRFETVMGEVQTRPYWQGTRCLTCGHQYEPGELVRRGLKKIEAEGGPPRIEATA